MPTISEGPSHLGQESILTFSGFNSHSSGNTDMLFSAMDFVSAEASAYLTNNRNLDAQNLRLRIVHPGQSSMLDFVAEGPHSINVSSAFIKRPRFQGPVPREIERSLVFIPHQLEMPEGKISQDSLRNHLGVLAEQISKFLAANPYSVIRTMGLEHKFLKCSEDPDKAISTFILALILETDTFNEMLAPPYIIQTSASLWEASSITPNALDLKEISDPLNSILANSANNERVTSFANCFDGPVVVPGVTRHMFKTCDIVALETEPSNCLDKPLARDCHFRAYVYYGDGLDAKGDRRRRLQALTSEGGYIANSESYAVGFIQPEGRYGPRWLGIALRHTSDRK